MRPDIRSLLHGIFNLILPFFAYDLAGLLVFSLTAGNYTPWASFWPMAGTAVIFRSIRINSDRQGLIMWRWGIFIRPRK